MDNFSELKAIAEKAKELAGINNYKKGEDAIAAFKAAAANPAVILALLAELEAKDKHIVALERINQAQDDHINQQQDRIESLEKKNGDLGQGLQAAEKRIAGLVARLATPVRLPTKYSMLHREDFHDDYQSKMVFKADEVIAALRAHGSTVEGDE
ncbi:TPA: ead/Ea22-like family protein [Serratia marcescens]